MIYMDKYLAGGVVLLAGWFGLKHSLRRKKGFAGEEQRKAVERAKGMNQMVSIDKFLPKKAGHYGRAHDLDRKYTFGKLENLPMSATEKFLFNLPLKKDGSLKGNAKIHIGWLSYPHYYEDLNKIWKGNICEKEGTYEEIDAKDFKDMVSMYYPVSIQESFTDVYDVPRNKIVKTDSDGNASAFYKKLVADGFVCKKCQERYPLYNEEYFFNPAGKVRLAEDDWQDDVEWDENYTPSDKYDDIYEDVEWEEES